MKNAIATVAVAGLASVALAGEGNIGTVTLSASNTNATAGDIITIFVSVSGGGNGVFNIDADITSADAGFNVVGGSGVVEAGVFGPGMSELANGYNFVGGATLFPTLTLLDGLVASFQIEYTGGEVTFVSSGATGDSVGTFIPDPVFGIPNPAAFDQVNDGSVTITPAPSGAALLGLGGLVAARRRR